MLLYNNFEIAKVAAYSPRYGEGLDLEPIHCEEDQDYADEHAVQQYWTIYGHLPEGGVEALVDVNAECKEHAFEVLGFFQEMLKAYKEKKGVQECSPNYTTGRSRPQTT